MILLHYIVHEVTQNIQMRFSHATYPTSFSQYCWVPVAGEDLSCGSPTDACSTDQVCSWDSWKVKWYILGRDGFLSMVVIAPCVHRQASLHLLSYTQGTQRPLTAWPGVWMVCSDFILPLSALHNIPISVWTKKICSPLSLARSRLSWQELRLQHLWSLP